MATLKLYFDKRSRGKDDKFPIKLMLRHKKDTTPIPLGLRFSEKEWAEIESRMKSGTESRHTPSRLVSQYKAQAESSLYDVRLENDLEKMSVLQIKEKMYEKMDREMSARDKKVTETGPFLAHFVKFSQKKTKKGTKTLYEQTMKKILAYDPEVSKRGFSDINKPWLEGFDAFLATTSGSAVRNRHFRNIRAVFNDAIDEDLTTAYPFRKFRMPKIEETRKRALTVEELKAVRDCECDPWMEEYRDMFMLMFYLIGINAADLFNAKPTDLVHGRLEYRRAKTSKLYSIKVEPEAKKIIEKYRGKNYLLSPMDRYADHRDYLGRMNKALHKLGMHHKNGCRYEGTPLFPRLSTYYSRHSWATLAARLDVPIDTISRALGHSIGSDVTNIYIDFDNRKIDQANRKVLDAIKEG